MSTNFSVIGGDLRIVKLIKILAKDRNTVYIYGIENVEELTDNKSIIICNNIIDAIKNTDIIIGPIPFSSDGKHINSPLSDKQIPIKEFIDIINEKTLIAGSITPEICEITNNKNIEIIDIMKREELAILNAISTAEGAIEIIIANTNNIIHKSNVLILGFGRIGKVLAKKLSGLSANVTCAARKKEDLAWIKADGYNETNILHLGENLSNYDTIINTVPHLILNENNLKYVKKNCLLVDLASKPRRYRHEISKR